MLLALLSWLVAKGVVTRAHLVALSSIHGDLLTVKQHAELVSPLD